MSTLKTLDIPVAGMDCTECTQHVRHAIAAVPGVVAVEVFLATEKATVQLDPAATSLEAIKQAIQDAGYSVPAPAAGQPAASTSTGLASLGRRVGGLLAVFFAAVIFVVVVGEWFGLFERITERVPWPLGLAVVLVAGFPVFRNVVQAALRRQIVSHTLMTLGVIAALAVGQWATALVVVFFMRVGDYVERFTTEHARRAVRDLTAQAPRTARVERHGREVEVPVGEVQVGEIVIVRPGEQIPVDGEVVAGNATIDQAAITGESMPVEAGAGTRVYAATFARLGSLRVRATGIGADTTFGRVIRLVEEAEAHRADVQRVADRFAGWYLPIVAGIAALTLLLRRDPLATAAVLVVACSCSFALATPVAMLASIATSAGRGLLVKGGRYLELLAQADILLIDKTGTVTMGKPQVTDIVDLGLGSADLGHNGANALPRSDPRSAILWLAASAERYSEHPLAKALRSAAHAEGLALAEPQDFEALPGLGVRATVNGIPVTVGNRRLTTDSAAERSLSALEAGGKTVMFVRVNGTLVGAIAAADTLRPEVPAALSAVRQLGVRKVELLTGDNERAAAALADQIGIGYQANLLPEDKIRIVKAYQAQGHVVVMVGDGVNDAPALAQADVGIAMATRGSDIAIEAAHVALMRDDWALIPGLLRIARRTMHIVKMNLGLSALYNVTGLSLAALGILPPVLAAAAQSLPDLGILGNSMRLLRQKT